MLQRMALAPCVEAVVSLQRSDTPPTVTLTLLGIQSQVSILAHSLLALLGFP